MSAIDVVIVSYNRRDLLLRCCEAAARLGPAVKTIVVDNHSGDGSVEAVASTYPGARILQMGANRGFAAAVNRGVAAGDSGLVLLLNSDATIDAKSLARLTQAIEGDEAVAACGPRIRDNNGELELSVDRTMTPFNEMWHLVAGRFHPADGWISRWLEHGYARDRSVRSLTAACLLLRRTAFESVDGMDERFFLYAEDVDLCRRLRSAGWKLRYVARAEAGHLRGASALPGSTRAIYRESQIAFYRKHHGPVRRALLRGWLGARYGLTYLVGPGSEREEAGRIIRWAVGGPWERR